MLLDRELRSMSKLSGWNWVPDDPTTHPCYIFSPKVRSDQLNPSSLALQYEGDPNTCRVHHLWFRLLSMDGLVSNKNGEKKKN